MKKSLVGILALVLIAGGYFFYSEQQYKTALTVIPDISRKNILFTVTIEKGSSVRSIANSLLYPNIIKNDGAFIRYVRENNLQNSLMAGSFTLNTGLTIPEVTDILTGKVVPDSMKITIKEGMTVRDIRDLMIEDGLATAKDFTDCMSNCDFRTAFPFLPKQDNPKYAFSWSYLEGYLFPDTYYISKAQFTVESFFKQMLSNFKKQVGSDVDPQIVIIASIIEKESRPKDDQAIVSGIIWKRLNEGIQLATDATNRYLMEAGEELTYKELTSTNPYNTRKQKGLPPSAISNPGLASITAAKEPKESTYYYYLHDANGQIHFADTENEHDRNKQIYLQ